MTHAWRLRLALVVLTLSSVACGEDELTGPVPEIAGTYAGSFIVQYLVNREGVAGSMQVVIEQAGENVTLTGSIGVAGVTVPIPAATGTLDTTGFLELTDGGFSGSVNEEFCGATRTISSTVRFFAGNAEISEHADTDFCGRVILSGSLSRQ